VGEGLLPSSVAISRSLSRKSSGKFGAYLKAKISRRELAPSIAQLAIAALIPKRSFGLFGTGPFPFNHKVNGPF
jgi:hypothetical protein